jgi:hypothetical protein
VELQRPGDRDAILRGPGSRPDWEVGSFAARPDTRAEPEEAASLEGGVQGSGDDGNRAARRGPTACRQHLTPSTPNDAISANAHQSSGIWKLRPSGVVKFIVPAPMVAVCRRSHHCRSNTGDKLRASNTLNARLLHPLDNRGPDRCWTSSSLDPRRWRAVRQGESWPVAWRTATQPT